MGKREICSSGLSLSSPLPGPPPPACTHSGGGRSRVGGGALFLNFLINLFGVYLYSGLIRIYTYPDGLAPPPFPLLSEPLLMQELRVKLKFFLLSNERESQVRPTFKCEPLSSPLAARERKKNLNI